MLCPYYYDAWKAMWTLRYLHNDSSSSLLSLWVNCLLYIEKYLLKEIVCSNFTWSTTPRSLAVNCWHQGDVYCIEVRPLMNWFIAKINRCSQISSRILRCFHIASIMLSATQIKTIPSIDSLQFQVQTFSGKSRKLSTGKLIETFFPALTWQLFAVCRSYSRFRTELKTVFSHFPAWVAHCV